MHAQMDLIVKLFIGSVENKQPDFETMPTEHREQKFNYPSERILVATGAAL